MLAWLTTFATSNILRYWKQLMALFVLLATSLRLVYLKSQNAKLKESVKQHETKVRILEKHSTEDNKAKVNLEAVSKAKSADDLNKLWGKK